MNPVTAKRVFFILILTVCIPLIFSCQKEPGEGGKATIYGKIFVYDYNSTFTELKEEYYAQDEDVYIVYGNDRSFGDHVKTSYNGTFEFKYLRPGDYLIYCYSKDSSLSTNAMIVRRKSITVNKKQDDVDAGIIAILK